MRYSHFASSGIRCCKIAYTKNEWDLMRTSKIQRILFDEIQGPSIQKEKERKEQ